LSISPYVDLRAQIVNHSSDEGRGGTKDLLKRGHGCNDTDYNVIKSIYQGHKRHQNTIYDGFWIGFRCVEDGDCSTSKQRPPDFELPRFDRRMLVKEALELMGVEIIDNDNGVDCIIGVLLQQLQLLHTPKRKIQPHFLLQMLRRTSGSWTISG
jgi:hypothetical protein